MSTATDLTAALSAAQSAAIQVINEAAAANVTVADLTRDLNDAAQVLGDLREANALLVSQVAEKDTEIARLQAIIDGEEEPPPPPPPPVTTSLIGATVGHDDGGLNVVADVRRCYNQGGLPTTVDASLKEASTRCRNSGVVWTSYKGTRPSDTTLRTALKAMSDFLRLKNQVGWVTYEHEPSIKGAIPPATYHAGYDQLERIIVEFDNLHPIVCLAGFDGDKDPSLWETYYRPNHPVIGFDHYNKGHQRQGEPMSTPAENYGPLLKWAKSKGKYVAIGETGVGDDAVPGSVIKTREQWYAEHRKFVLDPANEIVAACAFDSGLAVLSPSEARAWFNA
jgi:hypothetical protein